MRCEVMASMQLAVYHMIGRDDRNVEEVPVEGETQKDLLLSEARCLTDLSAIFDKTHNVSESFPECPVHWVLVRRNASVVRRDIQLSDDVRGHVKRTSFLGAGGAHCLPVRETGPNSPQANMTMHVRWRVELQLNKIHHQRVTNSVIIHAAVAGRSQHSCLLPR